MFIEREMEPGRPPCSYRRPCFQSDMALLTEGGPYFELHEKPDPPCGGQFTISSSPYGCPHNTGFSLSSARISSMNAPWAPLGGEMFLLPGEGAH